MILAEYIWIDGTQPVAQLRSKTKVLDLPTLDPRLFQEVDLEQIPVWGFDGSSTNQATGGNSDCILKPVRVVLDGGRGGAVLVLCEVLDSYGNPHSSNTRFWLERVSSAHESAHCWFGIEQEYVLLQNGRPLGWPGLGYPAPQGPYYCSVGGGRVAGRDLVEEHLRVCLASGLKIAGINAEVMLGQWEFQVGHGDPLLIADHLWLARYLLLRCAEEFGVAVTFDAKPMAGDWNGSGAHTNFSTADMRADGGIDVCISVCEKLRSRFLNGGYPAAYGSGFEQRLTGHHETCSWREFKYGVADRTASVRIPLHVNELGKGYIEDRRPCANADPYQVATYLIETACG